MEKSRPAKKILRPKSLRKRRKPRIIIPLTDEQKRAKKALSENVRKEYSFDLDGTRAQVIDLAKSLQKKHPGRKLQYYLGDITQSRDVKTERGLNLWNVFVREELKSINAST